MFQTGFKDALSGIRTQIDSFLRSSKNETESECLLCIKGFVEKAWLNGMNIAFELSVLKGPGG